MKNLKISWQTETLRLTTAFAGGSTVKSRIKMLFQPRSLKLALLKFTLLLPILVMMALWAFSFHIQDERLLEVEKDGKIGFINEKGELVIPYQFLQVKSLDKYILATKNEDSFNENDGGLVNKGWGVMNYLGKTVIPFEYDDFQNGFNEGLLATRKGFKWGYLNDKGEISIPFQYDYAGNFQYGLAPVRIGEKRGFIDLSGKIVIPIQYHKAFHFSEKLLRVETYPDFEHLLINHQNEIVARLPYYHSIGILQNGLALVSRENLFGLIDETGKEVVSLQYNQLQGWFRDGLLGACKDKKCGFIDQTGKTIIPFEYDFVGAFSEGLASIGIKKGDKVKYGFIDKTQKIIIPLKYDQAFDFNEGLASVSKNGKYGFINQSGKTVIPFQYTMVANFQNGIAKVMKGKKMFYIDKTGHEIKPKPSKM